MAFSPWRKVPGSVLLIILNFFTAIGLIFEGYNQGMLIALPLLLITIQAHHHQVSWELQVILRVSLRWLKLALTESSPTLPSRGKLFQVAQMRLLWPLTSLKWSGRCLLLRYLLWVLLRWLLR